MEQLSRAERELDAGRERGSDIELVIEHAGLDEVGSHLVEDTH
jgi:hypothetical protein